MRKKIIVICVLVLVLLAGGYAGRSAYIHLRHDRLIKQARNFIASNKEKKALFALQRVLKANPKDLEACRLMAVLTEAGRSPSALLWRSRVVELNPSSIPDRLAMAQTAISARDYASATNALEGVSVEGKKTAEFHNVAGMLESTINRYAEAEAHFLEAIRLSPTNLAPQLSLAVVRLRQTNAPGLVAARSTLQQLTANPAFRSQALRELVIDALRYQQTNQALAMSKDLLLDTNSVFSDRLLRLEVLRVTQNPELKSAITTFQNESTNNPGYLYEMATWQMSKNGPLDLLAWLKSLPSNISTNQPVALLIAQCHTALKDWRGLQTSIEKQNWGEIEFIRHTFFARSLREQSMLAASKTEWTLAVKSTEDQLQGLVMLLRLVVPWNWAGESEELLWKIVRTYPTEKWAMRALTIALFEGGRTRSLMSLYSGQLAANPNSLLVKNDLAMMALLLDAKELKPHDLAREVYENASTNSNFISTYAFSLFLQKKNSEALKTMEQIQSKELDDPSMAGYYGMILKANGNPAKAKAYLELASKARVLPEERKLFDAAKAGL
jgi:tetratricopeptide (TPR) repeat protein